MNLHNSFVAGFEKIAAPSWFYNMNKTLAHAKNLKNHSSVGLKNIKEMKEIVKK